MFDYLSLDNSAGEQVFLHGGGSGAAVSNVEGLLGVTAPRELVRQRSQASGSVVRTKYTTDRLIVLQGECWGPTFDAAQDRFDGIAQAAADTLSAPGRLRWQRMSGLTGLLPGGVGLQTDVVLAGELKPPLTGAGRFLRWQMQLRAEDPRVYDQQEVSVAGSPLSGVGGGRVYPLHYPYVYAPRGGGSADMIVTGKAATPPVLTVYGYCRNPTLQLDSTGERIVLLGEVGPADFLEVDVARRSIRLNGVTGRLSMRDPRATTWWDLPPGAQSVSLLAADFDTNARVDVRYRPAY